MITVTRADKYQVTIDFHGPDINTVYACWIEDESGNNLQNVYICPKLITDVTTAKNPLSGDAIPYWSTVKYPGNGVFDTITTSSIKGSAGLNAVRNLSIGNVRKFYVCFEIDRSWNSNAYFQDRPSFIYRSGIIDLDSLSSTPYDLSLYGWMSNNTTDTGLSQQPKITIPGFLQYKLMTAEDNIKYIIDTDGDYNDMVTSLTANITVL